VRRGIYYFHPAAQGDLPVTPTLRPPNFSLLPWCYPLAVVQEKNRGKRKKEKTSDVMEKNFIYMILDKNNKQIV